ncbi:helix-turn-helix transcriptional regulator [Dokdonella sp.]|uniref:helix-turn-helix transcriptional regulator n=1 Tax=Dokdonella sp. TaxID=2291710 RepID=UPI0035277A5C
MKNRRESESGLPLVLLKLPEVRFRTSLSGSEIYRRIAADPPSFPVPVKLGQRASAWLEHEVTEWCEARIAARDAHKGGLRGNSSILATPDWESSRMRATTRKTEERNAGDGE